MNRQDFSRGERRNRTLLIVISGVVVLALLIAWAVILRREAIEDDLTARAAAALTQAGVEASDIRFDGRDGTLTVEAPLAESASILVGSLEGVRTVTVETVPMSTTTTTTAPPVTTSTTAATTTTTTTVPLADASFTLTSDTSGITLSGRMTPADAAAIGSAASDVFGPERVSNAITTDDATASPGWIEPLGEAVPQLRFVADPGIAIDAEGITLAGDLPSEERRAEVLTAFAALGLPVADGMALAVPPGPAEATALQQALNAALIDTTVLFDYGSATVSLEGEAQLDPIAELIIAAPGARVEVGGHTDSEGPAEDNLVLSLQRAEAVVAFLVERGVDPVQLTAVGYGEDFPVADNATPEGRAANRRIEFTVEGSE